MLRMRPSGIAAALIVLSVAPVTVRAQTKPPESLYPPSTPKLGEYAAVGTLTGGLVLASVFIKPPETASWQGGLLFDDSVRDAVRMNTPRGREIAGSISDALMVSSIAYPVVVDALFSTAIMQGDGKQALHMVVDDAASFLITGILVATMKNTIGRERPAMRDCPDCVETSSYQSFPSGHTAMAFTGAGLMCSQEASRNGSGATCIAGLAMASATGVMRIAADRHYATDVLAGAAIGLASGYLVPLLLHEVLDW